MLFQVSLLQSMLQGDYDGFITVKDLKQYGDTGIGTFHGVNGEMIFLDGTVYRALWDGSIEIVGDDEVIPFSNVTFFDADIEVANVSAPTLEDLKVILNSVAASNGQNQFYVAKLKGSFPLMFVRSELQQKKPYIPLAEAMKTDQREFTYNDVTGTVIALYCPSYMSSLNTPGWHLHFLSDDGQKGGHILEMSIGEASLAMDIISEFALIVPNRDSFNEKNLGIDMREEIRQVEVK